eukprot:5238883-Pleurochrysis_carterae.AAC.2
MHGGICVCEGGHARVWLSICAFSMRRAVERRGSSRFAPRCGARALVLACSRQTQHRPTVDTLTAFVQV